MPKYKHGKITKPFSLDILAEVMRRVEKVDRSGYEPDFIRAAIAVLYWFPLRRSEVFGDSGHKWKVQDKNQDGKVVGFKIRESKPFPGLFKDNIWKGDNYVFIFQIARKHGDRQAPIARLLSLPYIDLIVKQWEKTAANSKVFPIDEVMFWRILKRVDPKLYPHAFLANRITQSALTPEISLAEIVQETGKDPKTIAEYMLRVGRDSKAIADKTRK